MGKPAARLTDNTAHGGLITGPGCPTVLIGKMPAATLGDMHVCPMMTPAVPPIPHVGGPITLGSTGVFIGKKPAARLGDMCVCVGPPSTVILGCMTVLIGEAGSGSQAGSAGAAAAAQAAKMKGPKALEQFPVEEPGKPGEMHFIQSEFADAGGKVFQGAPYHLTDPDKKEPLGASSSEGGLYHDGFAKAGKFDLKVPALSDIKWAKESAGLKEKVNFSAQAEGVEDGVEAQAHIFEEVGNNQRLLESFSSKVSGGKISGTWGWKESYFPSDDVVENSGSPVFRVFIAVAGMVGFSNRLELSDTITVKVTDADGNAQKELEYEARFSNGEMRKGKLDGSGQARIENAPPRRVKVRLPKPPPKKK